MSLAAMMGDPAPDDRDEPTHERTKSRLVVIVPALILLALLAWGFLQPSNVEKGETPDFELALLGGGSISSDDLRGKPLVLNFWASWCIPCREEMPAFERMWRRYRDSGIQIVGVNYQDSEQGAREFVDEIGVTYPIALDPDGSLARELGVRGLPQTFFIDESFQFEKLDPGQALEGAGDRVVFGAIDEETLRSEIEDLLD